MDAREPVGVLEFVAGAELAYAGFDGRPYTGRWHRDAARLDIVAADGRVFATDCREAQAVIFWLTVHDRPFPARPVAGSEPDTALSNVRAYHANAPAAPAADQQGSLF